MQRLDSTGFYWGWRLREEQHFKLNVIYDNILEWEQVEINLDTKWLPQNGAAAS